MLIAQIFQEYAPQGLSIPASIFFLLLVCFIIKAIYNVWFHPLAGTPGSLSWQASRFPFIFSLWSGWLIQDLAKLHARYGDVVRTAPDEVSFASEDVWQDVFGTGANNKPFPRNSTFFKAPPGQPDNVVTTTDPKASIRMRQTVGPAFTERAVIQQEAVIVQYANLMTSQIIERAKSSSDGSASINIVDWVNWFAFDTVAELTFGESFGCLRETKHHPWITMIFGAVKLMALAATTRYFKGLEEFLIWMLPPSIRKIQQDHYATALDKLHRRMERKTEQYDFVTPMIEENVGFHQMSLPEVESTTAMLLIAGSETTGTTICGILQHLVMNPSELSKLETEIRAFQDIDSMTLTVLQKLPFLNATINEGLRLCNPVSLVLRLAPNGGAMVCGRRIPAGTHVTINPIVMARSEKYFHQASEFLPERFLPEHARPARFANDQRDCLKSFGIGSRACLGKSFALAEMRALLANLIWNFDITQTSGHGIVDWMKLKSYIIIQKEPIPLSFKPRRKP